MTTMQLLGVLVFGAMCWVWGAVYAEAREKPESRIVYWVATVAAVVGIAGFVLLGPSR